jgi:hypothetical protein
MSELNGVEEKTEYRTAESYPEGHDSRFPQNVGTHQPNFTVSHLRRQ